VSPIALYQAVQPMSDVPAAALWVAATAAVARRDGHGAIAGGWLASAAVLVRPNLALPVPVLACVLLASRSPRRGRLRLVAMFVGAALPCLFALAWLNARRYGSPFVSGYGAAGALFALAHVPSNLQRYAGWLLSTETPFVLLACLAPWWAWRRRRREMPLAVATLVAVALIVSTYLAYTVFSDWWYVRFLLPAIPLALVLAAAVWLSLAGGRPIARGAIAIVTCVALGGFYVHVARERRVFELRSLESRFVLTGAYAARALPAGAVVLAVQESGAVRHHGGRLTAMWDQLDAADLDRGIGWLAARGRPVFIAVEDPEVPVFRARFAGQQFGGLDWPPRAVIHAPIRVLVYAAEDRARFRRGVPLSPEHVR
jgi:4-amino-4-deoxy-L-arabinose transferase-like glycosyltransferase